MYEPAGHPTRHVRLHACPMDPVGWSLVITGTTELARAHTTVTKSASLKWRLVPLRFGRPAPPAPRAPEGRPRSRLFTNPPRSGGALSPSCGFVQNKSPAWSAAKRHSPLPRFGLPGSFQVPGSLLTFSQI